MENYFNYFTEIEEHFQRRRGGILLLSTLDWALIETWKDAGIPLEAALRGIDAAFDRYDQRPSKSKKVNSLAYCAQEVLTAAEDMKEAAVGASPGASDAGSDPASGQTARGFEPAEIVRFLRNNADKLEQAKLPAGGSSAPAALGRDSARTLRELADDLSAKKAMRLEEVERRLTVLEEKLLAALMAATPDADLMNVRAQADRELAPYRSKMPGAQIEQLLKQYIHKRLLEKYELPRLSLFYM